MFYYLHITIISPTFLFFVNNQTLAIKYEWMYLNVFYLHSINIIIYKNANLM